jgi:hypothetical protein
VKKQGPRTPAAVKVGSGSHIHIKNSIITGAERPFDISPGGHLTLENVRIQNDPKLARSRRSARIEKTSSTTGWRRLSGAPLPVFCPQCKAIFPSRNYVFAGCYFNSWGSEEQCIECGFDHARLSDGIFDLTGEVMRIVSAPDITHAMLRAIKGVAEQLAEGRLEPVGAASRLNRISPKLAKLLRRSLKFGYGTVCFGLLVLSAYYAREQVRLGSAQVRLQEEANVSSDKALEATLQALANIHAALKKVEHPGQQQVTEDQPPSPAEGKAAPKPRLTKRHPKRKPSLSSR